MPAEDKIKPGKWRNIKVLFDNGWYSVIWGDYKDLPYRCVGVRWNGKANKLGYPNQAGYSLWYVEPEFLTKTILIELKKQVEQNGAWGKLDNIILALEECESTTTTKGGGLKGGPYKGP
jgi:hypothetical protein